jgi:hypothetical protein
VAAGGGGAGPDAGAAEGMGVATGLWAAALCSPCAVQAIARTSVKGHVKWNHVVMERFVMVILLDAAGRIPPTRYRLSLKGRAVYEGAPGLRIGEGEKGRRQRRTSSCRATMLSMVRWRACASCNASSFQLETVRFAASART